jgi:hypothetical protein
MESDMAVDTAVDAELWLILAAMIGWIMLGCFLTARGRHHEPRQSPRHAATKAKKRPPASKRREALDLAPLSLQL